MEYFKKMENAKEYIALSMDYDPTFIVTNIESHLPFGSTILELGMGPGKDLEVLQNHYDVTGSDNAQSFIDLYNDKNPIKDAIYLDVIEMNIEEKFDCIFSNKVLSHLNRENFIKSLIKQKENLNSNGYIIMSMWKGEYEEVYDIDMDINFTYYDRKDIEEIIKPIYSNIEIIEYSELEENDSFLIFCKE